MFKEKKIMNQKLISKFIILALFFTIIPPIDLTAYAADETVSSESNDGYLLSNEYFKVKIGEYGEIESLKLTEDEFDTNYVLNSENAPEQGASSEHQWMGELLFKTKKDGDENWSESETSASAKDSSARTISKEKNKVTVTYKNESADKGIKDFQVTETYELVDNKLKWSMKVTNTNDVNLTFGDFGLPMPFNEYWTCQGDEQLYESRVVYHSFVGQDSSYIYATRASGQGKFLLFTPDESTGAKLEYQDHWRIDNGHEGSVWAQDQGGWANGLNVFYIHSNVIKSSGSSYLDNTELTLSPGESKEYSFNFTGVDSEENMKSSIYNEGLIDAVAVPGMAFSKNMPAKFYLHTKYDIGNIENIEVQCSHDTKLYEGLENSVSNKQSCTKDEGTSAIFKETKVVNGEKYHVYDLNLSCLGANHVIIHYKDDKGEEKVTTLQFYVMDNAEDALNSHADFVVDKTQVSAPGEIQDYIFDDWMMDTKSVRGVYSGYFGWGDDWGFTHGEYLAEKNVYLPVKKQIEAVDNYLDTTIWNGLMKEHQEDYKVNDWLDDEPNSTGQGTSRGYAYPHVYNTYFSMYKVEKKYPEMVEYKENRQTYLLRAANILMALYSEGVYYNWDTGLMGESTTPEIIEALKEEGFYDEAEKIVEIMNKKYLSFCYQKYPYGSEYSYDNTGEEAVYTLAKLNGNTDMMKKIDKKTRACRGLQPIWYHYANPTTICGENWWNFQYSASLIGYCMDDWLRNEDNGMTSTEKALASRVNYAAKLANLTSINSGQIDADPENIGTVAWTYQSELGNNGAQGTGGGNLHNGWRQMSGEADTGLFGALHILSSDVVTNDPVFGVFGYGCDVTDGFLDYVVKPLDGLYTRLNFINEGLNIELDRDQYIKAIVKKDCSLVQLTMKNIEGTNHNSEVEVSGLKDGAYKVVVNGTKVSSFTAVSGQTMKVIVPMTGEANTESIISIEPEYFVTKTAPEINAGEDKVVKISDDTSLEGVVTSNLNNSLTYKWTVESSPENSNPIIKNSDQLISKITFDKAGEYKFKLTVSDSSLTSEDTIKITVEDDDRVKDILASYSFDNIDTLDRRNRELLSDEEGYTSERVSNPLFEEGKNGNALSLSGSYCGYIRMPKEVTKNVDECTISVDVNLRALQSNDARIFEFRDTSGRYFYVSMVNGNKFSFGMTDKETLIENKVVSQCMAGINYWINVAVTIKDNTAVLYVNGEEAGKIENCNFKLSDLSNTQRNFIGRGDSKTSGFFNGLIDNFSIKSTVESSEEIKEKYGFKDEKVKVMAEASNVVCKAGEKPVLPEKVNVLYSDGLYKEESIVWDEINSSKYDKAGTFVEEGTVENLKDKVKIKIHVVSGEAVNVALSASASGIIDSVYDLGGVKGLNDGFEPSSSSDTSNGVWHNWQGNQSGSAWVQYTWTEPVIITESDVYYFKDWAGNFLPSSVSYEYEDENGLWHDLDNVQGLGTEENKFNKTTFAPVSVQAIRMNMLPSTLGCGVIEWQVYGYNEDSNNIASSASVSTSYVSPWETLSAVNDGKSGVNSIAEGISHYGSWGNTSEYETVTYTWDDEQEISKSSVFFWNDGNGILTPKSYSYEYEDSAGKWIEVSNPKGLSVNLDRYNITTFDKIKTKSFRIKIYKQNNDGNGIGIVEWKVFKYE